jgi:probable phosphoglycerate mutase
MTARLILARHGNTFTPQDNPIWVGARSDLPLVDKGLAQSQAIADALIKAHILPTSIITGPLQRTRQMANIIAQKLNIASTAICIEPRLAEIDYGAWEGKSSSEIEAMGGGAELAAWNKSSIFPTIPGWSPGEAQIIADTQAILAETANNALIITSNGILRFFARATLNAAAFPDRKVATGHLCIMEKQTDGWHILQWNTPPEKLQH